jgi:hypothetical protein
MTANSMAPFWRATPSVNRCLRFKATRHLKMAIWRSFCSFVGERIMNLIGLFPRMVCTTARQPSQLSFLC